MLTLLRDIQEALTPQAAEAVARFLQPADTDVDAPLRRIIATQLEKHYPPRYPFYCCPETQLLSLMVCVVTGKDLRDDAQLHKSVMMDLLHRRLPCRRYFLREWPLRVPLSVSRDARAPESMRRLAREMTKAWVVRLAGRDDSTPFLRINACVCENA